MNKSGNKWVFIINPVAGNGRAKTIIPKLKQSIQKYDIDAELVFTEGYGHASELSAEYLKKGFTHIIAVGGDGTINEVSRPLVNVTDITIGIIPAGTGNDFIQILGFHDHFEDTDWDIFFRSNTIGMDAGICNGKTFLNGMGLGFDAQVAAENYTEPGKVKPGGKHKYIWHIVKTLLFFREKRMIVVTGDKRTDSDCFINTIANGRRFAGDFYLTPRAIANDGLLDVCMIKKLNLLQRFAILLKVPKGLHINDRKVNYSQVPQITLEFTREVPFHVDGELFFASNFDVKILPLALNIIYNPDGKHYFKK